MKQQADFLIVAGFWLAVFVFILLRYVPQALGQ
jgi:hypothetical protein